MRRESVKQRADRCYAELLQELRLVQVGVQVLMAFLFTFAFTPRFLETTPFQRGVYTVAWVLIALATSLFLAPAPLHRLLFQRGLKPHLVKIANRLAFFGMIFLVLALSSALLLVLDLMLGHLLAVSVSSIIGTWFVIMWFVYPLRIRRRYAEQR